MENFQSLGLPATLLQSLKQMQFSTPTPIQAQTIPVALEGADILGSAQTGTGKTAAYGIPLVAHLLNTSNTSALVLAPTRELACQVLATLKQLLANDKQIHSTLLIGGDFMSQQLQELKRKPRLIVGTPGRVNDHLGRGSLKLNKADFLVLDETDLMLDLGFDVQLQKIMEYLPQKRQTLMFSATMEPRIVKIANNYLQDAIRVSVGSTTSPTAQVKQEVIVSAEAEKYNVLLKLLQVETQGTYIIFVKTKVATEQLAIKLRKSGHNADAIHGNLRQRQRDRVIKAFRDGKTHILVATDVAARGLDISHVECVINHDLPQCPKDYIHRIGRAGRAGAEGRAITIVTPTSQDNIKWKNICRLINPNSKQPDLMPNNQNGQKKKSRKFPANKFNRVRRPYKSNNAA